VWGAGARPKAGNQRRYGTRAAGTARQPFLGGGVLMGDMQLKVWTIGTTVLTLVITLAIVGLMFS
jgi:hypothetical protein